MAEGYLLIKSFADLATAEADIKTKYTWSSVSEKHFIYVSAETIVLYAQGSA